MANSDAAQLGEFVGELALDAIRLQQLWNDAHTAEHSQFVQMVKAHPQIRELLMPLAPPLMSLSEFVVDAAVQIDVARKTEFTLTAKPINLEFTRRYQINTEQTSRIRITVTSGPMNHNKSKS